MSKQTEVKVNRPKVIVTVKIKDVVHEITEDEAKTLHHQLTVALNLGTVVRTGYIAQPVIEPRPARWLTAAPKTPTDAEIICSVTSR